MAAAEAPGGRIVRATPETIARAARLIAAGRLVAFPTETVYGLGADATDDRAVARVFEAKRRPSFNPLIIHLTAARDAARIVVLDARARRLAERFWPGPLTLVLPRAAGSPVSLLAGAGLETLGVRVPGGPVARELIAAAGVPVAAPSANPAGALSPTRAEHVAAGLGEAVALILDAGPCEIGIESTVVDLTGPQAALLRPGGLPVEEVEAVIGPVAAGPPDGAGRPRAPGGLASHYAPALPLRIDAREVRPGEALLSFGRHRLAGFAAEENLSPSGDLVEAAANLFAMLRRLDRPELAGIVAMPVPETGLGRAIMDRLRRAAAARPLAEGAPPD